ncbi:MAG TPA: hypothetical protein VD788_12745 [Candidatus Polarisedimenticolaceae bacterium]|nr:hypothetical protein [Candidatus Polarisedimenticolaceae bacterium]
MIWKPQKNREKSDQLDRALAAWHRSGAESPRLGDRARRAALAEAARARSTEALPAPFSSLFVPFGRLAVAAATPVVILSLMVGSVLLSDGALHRDTGIATSPTRIDAVKTGDEVVFLIHNGSRRHTISKSEIAHDFAAEGSVTVTTGQFRDRLDSGAEIVYYRID